MTDGHYLLYLDHYHLGDRLFLQSLARGFARAQPVPPCVVLHGGGEEVARALEAQGYFPEREEGIVAIATPEEGLLAERAVREVNRRLTSLFTDEAVPAVGVQGIDRTLLFWEGDRVCAARVGWVLELVRNGVVPIISALVRGDGALIREVPLVSVATSLAEAFDTSGAGQPTIVFFNKNNRPGLRVGEAIAPVLSLAQLPGTDVLAEHRAVEQVVRAGPPVLVTNTAGLFARTGPQGTQIVP
jgi:hypothetical protein